MEGPVGAGSALMLTMGSGPVKSMTCMPVRNAFCATDGAFKYGNK